MKNNERLYLDCFEKYSKALKLDPYIDFIYTGWGNALYKLEIIKNDKHLFLESFEKFKLATKLNPTDMIAYYYWGEAFFCLAKMEQDKKLYHEAMEKFEKAAELDVDNKLNLYYMACSYAVVGNKIAALNILTNVLEKSYVKAEYVLLDEYWKSCKDEDEFKNLMKKIDEQI